MKRIVLGGLLLAGGLAVCSAASRSAASFPSDLGPRSIGLDAGQVPEAGRGGYSLALSRCGACHTPARALHYRYAEPEGRDVPDKEAAVVSLKADHPEFFKEPFIWQVEADVWKRCVARMAAKPASGINEGDAKAIRLFLSWDSSRRKLGKGAAAWKALRQALLHRFKAANPGRYADLLASDAL
ncbi:MAG: hypothetical protein WC943_08935 [Elusimicrobiota bacterium]